MSGRDRVVRRVAIVLPPREFFSPEASGALGLLARRHAAWGDGFEATVFGPPPPKPPFPGVTFMPVEPSWWIGPQVAGYARAVGHAVDRARPNLIEVHNRPDLALRLARRRAVTLILNNDPRGMRGARTPAERLGLMMRLAGVATASAFLEVCLLDGIADSAVRPTILPNALDFGELPAPAAARDQTILFAGRVVADKGADAFVAACALALPDLPGWSAEMIGGDRFGPENPETPFLRALRPRAAAAGVVMHGYRPHRDVLAAMARAAIVVVPSRWPEPFGLTAVEAMACGAALLCSNRGGLAEVTGDAAVRIDPDDTAAFAAAIVALARDPTRRAAVAEAGRVRAERFGMPRVGPMLSAFRHASLARFRAGHAAPI